MGQVRCQIPITLRVLGELGDDQLARLEDALVRILAERIALAERTTRRAGRLTPAPATDVREPFDPARFDPVSQTYQIRSYNGGKRRAPVTSASEPFAGVLRKLTQTISALSEFVFGLEAVADQPIERHLQVRALKDQLDEMGQERRATEFLASTVRGRVRREDPPDDLREITAKLVTFYTERNRPFPSPAVTSIRVKQLERALTLMAILRTRVAIWDRLAAAQTDPGQEPLKRAYQAVGTYYVEVGTLRWTPAVGRLAFLDTFYQDPSIVPPYAIVRFARSALPELWTNLRAVSFDAEGGLVLREELTTRTRVTELASDSPRMEVVGSAVNRAAEILRRTEKFGDLPRSQEEVRQVPGPEDGRDLAAQVNHLQVQIAVLALWQPLEALRGLIYSHNAIGTSLNPFVAEEDENRSVWLREIDALAREFEREAGSYPHPNIERKVAGWERRVKRLIEEIPPVARRWRIIKAIAEQIPFLFVGGAVASGVAAWVGAVTRGSRWLIAIAEGITFTAFTALTAPRGLGRPTTALGWTVHLALNIGWARLGRALFTTGGDVAQRLALSRRLILDIGTRVVLPGATLATLQTIVQRIENRARGLGGESSFTEMLTINLIMNALGILIGASLPQRAPTPGAGTPSGTGTGQLVRTPAELARTANIPEEAARQWLRLADRADQFQSRFAELARDARAGRLTPEQFEQWRRSGLELANDLERQLPGLAQALGTGQTPEQIRAGVQALRSRLEAISYSPPGGGRVLLLPEFLPGLTRVGETVTWTYDPASPPTRLAALRRSYQERGLNVRDLPGGGWEATNARGETVLQALPLTPQAGARLAPALQSIASGPQARAGLELVRQQVAAPQLEAQLSQAAVQSPTAVTRILRAVGRFVPSDQPAAWDGLSNYLRRGGDPEVLARTLTFGHSREFGAENRLHVLRVLPGMKDWDASAVRGLAQLFQVGPRTGSDRLQILFGDYEPAQVTGILQSIDLLAPRSRGLSHLITAITSSDYRQQRGGIGALRSGVELAERHPGTTIEFEATVRNEGGAVIRVQDIRVIETTRTRVAGQVVIQERVIGTFEIKEISTASLGRRAPHELAIDIVLDSLARSQMPTPPGAGRPFFTTFRWRIRALELRRRAARRLGLDPEGSGVAQDPRVDAAMRAEVRERLRPAFDDPALSSLSEQERQGYRNAFESLPFVEFF